MNQHQSNTPTGRGTPTPNPFKPGDRVRFRNGPVVYDVLAVAGLDVWGRPPSGIRVTLPARHLTLVPDTVTVELPRDLAERWADRRYPNYERTVDACRKALNR